MLLVVVLATIVAPTWQCEALVMGFSAIITISWGRWRYALLMTTAYGLVIAGMLALASTTANALTTMVMAFFMLVRKVFPCALLAGGVVSTTRTGEFMAALTKLRVPRTLSIPLAVMMRYLPMVREDWHFISDAMRMRGLSPTPLGLLRTPARTVECVYVPMLMSASTTADELSMASIARGIENPARHTSLVPLRFTGVDALTLALGACLLAVMIVTGAAR